MAESPAVTDTIHQPLTLRVSAASAQTLPVSAPQSPVAIDPSIADQIVSVADQIVSCVNRELERRVKEAGVEFRLELLDAPLVFRCPFFKAKACRDVSIVDERAEAQRSFHQLIEEFSYSSGRVAIGANHGYSGQGKTCLLQILCDAFESGAALRDTVMTGQELVAQHNGPATFGPRAGWFLPLDKVLTRRPKRALISVGRAGAVFYPE